MKIDKVRYGIEDQYIEFEHEDGKILITFYTELLEGIYDHSGKSYYWLNKDEVDELIKFMKGGLNEKIY